MEVLLASCGNPDHFQDPDRPMYGCECNHYVTVKTLEEASIVCRKFIKHNYLGGGNWIGGKVYQNNKYIALISHTGKILPPELENGRKKEDTTKTKQELLAVGIGDVPAWLAEDGLALAVLYFLENDLEPQACFEANKACNNLKLASHWKRAESIANRVLVGNSKYDNSMIILDYDVF